MKLRLQTVNIDEPFDEGRDDIVYVYQNELHQFHLSSLHQFMQQRLNLDTLNFQHFSMSICLNDDNSKDTTATFTGMLKFVNWNTKVNS